MQSHIQSHVQSILVPKGHFKSEQEASRHVQDMGFSTTAKPVHITDNFYRYRQTAPRPDEQYRTIGMGKDKAIYSIGNQQSKIISHDHHKLIDHDSLKEAPKEQRQSLNNPKIGYMANVIKPNHKMPGQDGGGIWKQEYRDQAHQRVMGYQTMYTKSDLTPSSVEKPWVVQARNDRILYAAGIKPRKSYFDISAGGRNQKKYF